MRSRTTQPSEGATLGGAQVTPSADRSTWPWPMTRASVPAVPTAVSGPRRPPASPANSSQSGDDQMWPTGPPCPAPRACSTYPTGVSPNARTDQPRAASPDNAAASSRSHRRGPDDGHALARAIGHHPGDHHRAVRGGGDAGVRPRGAERPGCPGRRHRSSAQMVGESRFDAGGDEAGRDGREVMDDPARRRGRVQSGPSVDVQSQTDPVTR